MKIFIEGHEGNFGSFLMNELKNFNKNKLEIITTDFEEYDEVGEYDVVILAVPLSAYDKIASKHKGKLLINICSVQEQSDEICRKYSENVVSIHPMFGSRSPKEGRACVLTNVTGDVTNIYKVFNIFSPICDKILFSNNGKDITPQSHDEMMALTHVKVVELSEQISKIVSDAEHINEELLPTSFKKLRDLAKQFLDMPEGTKSSIMSNKYKV